MEFYQLTKLRTPPTTNGSASPFSFRQAASCFLTESGSWWRAAWYQPLAKMPVRLWCFPKTQSASRTWWWWRPSSRSTSFISSPSSIAITDTLWSSCAVKSPMSWFSFSTSGPRTNFSTGTSSCTDGMQSSFCSWTTKKDCTIRTPFARPSPRKSAAPCPTLVLLGALKTPTDFASCRKTSSMRRCTYWFGSGWSCAWWSRYPGSYSGCAQSHLNTWGMFFSHHLKTIYRDITSDNELNHNKKLEQVQISGGFHPVTQKIFLNFGLGTNTNRIKLKGKDWFWWDLAKTCPSIKFRVKMVSMSWKAYSYLGPGLMNQFEQ